MEGWIKLHRRLLENPLWKCEPFTRGQAWVDLILLANHKGTFFYKRNIKINVERGQVARSEVELADRWKWSRSKVRKFLKDLQDEQQIEQQKNNVTQVITINNYEEYQGKEQQGEQQNEQEAKQEKKPPKTTKKPPKKPQEDTYKNVKKEEKEKKEQEEKKKIYTFQEKYDYFIKNFNELTGRKFRGDDKTKRQFKDRLKNGYVWSDFKKAILNLYKDEHHKKNNFKHATPELLTRPEKFEMFLNASQAESSAGKYPGKLGKRKPDQKSLLTKIQKEINDIQGFESKID